MSDFFYEIVYDNKKSLQVKNWEKEENFLGDLWKMIFKLDFLFDLLSKISFS